MNDLWMYIKLASLAGFLTSLIAIPIVVETRGPIVRWVAVSGTLGILAFAR